MALLHNLHGTLLAISFYINLWAITYKINLRFQVTIRLNLLICFFALDQFQSYSSRGNDEMEVTEREPPRNLFDDI